MGLTTSRRRGGRTTWRKRPGAPLETSLQRSDGDGDASRIPRCSQQLSATGTASARQLLLLAALRNEDVLAELRAAWAVDGWHPPRKAVASWFYWTLPRKLLGECNPRWRAMAFKAPPPAACDGGRIPLVVFPSGGGSIPPRAEALLKARECCVMRQHGLWPSAARWADAAYLREELAKVPMRALGNTAQRKDFHYFREGKEGLDPNGLFGAEKLRLSADEWTPPPVTAVYMRIEEYLRHRGVAETEAAELQERQGSATDMDSMRANRGAEVAVERTCLYLQHNLLDAAEE